jgi:alpha-1,2-mannosyltransferase
LTLGLVIAWVADRRGNPLVSGVALGLVLAVKPQFAPVLLWPLVRRRWGTFAAALASGAAATLVGVVVVGPRALVDWVAYVSSRQPDGFWDNNTLPAAAARLFRDNHFVDPVATIPWAEPAAYVLAVGIIVLTALRVRRDPEMGLWALVAASLLAPSVSWHNYLVLLCPGVLLLLARGWTSPALLLLALQFIPPVWSEPWRHGSTIVAALMLNLYLYILLTHWLVFFLSTRTEPRATKEAEVS